MILRVVTVSILAVALGANAAAALSASARAHRCCAKTQYTCAGLKSPDDCCQGMLHATVEPGSATITPLAPLPVDTQATTVVVQFAVSGRSVANPADRFKRPHDPPHLHAFALVI